MGFLPGSGAFRFASELAHYRQSVDLVRALMDHACTAAELAYAWGWLTHVLVDMDLHPVIGRACGEALEGDRELRMNAMDSATAHISLEVGADVALLSRPRALPGITPREGLAPEEIQFVAAAYSTTYSMAFPVHAFERAHRRSIWLNQMWPTLLRVVSGSSSLLERSAAVIARRVFPPDSAEGATIRPSQPPAWVMDRIDRGIEGFPDRLNAVAATGLAALDNHNLESGVRGETDPEHAPALSVLARLDHHRSGRGSLTALLG